MRPGAYTRIFKSDHDRAVTAGGLTALGVYLALCRIHSDAAPEEKDSFRAGAARIARHAGVSTKTAKRMLPILARENLITILSGRRKDRTGDNEENRITLQGGAGLAKGRDSQSPGRDFQSAQNVPRIKKASKEAKRNRSGGAVRPPAASAARASSSPFFE